MKSVNPYLNFPGKTEEAFNFYKSIFGGEFIALQRFSEIPGNENVPEDAKDKIMHIALPIGEGTILMATDAMESMGQQLTVGDNVSIALGTESEEESDKLFAGLSAGGKVTMPLEKAFWGDYFGACIDKFGISWMISYDYK